MKKNNFEEDSEESDEDDEDLDDDFEDEDEEDEEKKYQFLKLFLFLFYQRNFMKKEEKLLEENWRNKLSREQHHILREKGTEQPFSSHLNKNKETGDYFCMGCGAKLFSSKMKFDSGTGWPSFSDSENNSIEFKEDNSHFMKRIEVLCKKCGGHLGHVFDDGPKPTRKRYCINGTCLRFEKKD